MLIEQSSKMELSNKGNRSIELFIVEFSCNASVKAEEWKIQLQRLHKKKHIKKIITKHLRCIIDEILLISSAHSLL